jgi:hypothetical protein
MSGKVVYSDMLFGEWKLSFAQIINVLLSNAQVALNNQLLSAIVFFSIFLLRD